MKFLCLAYEEESTLNGLSHAEWDALRIETLAYWPSARLGSIEVRPIEEVLREERRY